MYYNLKCPRCSVEGSAYAENSKGSEFTFYCDECFLDIKAPCEQEDTENEMQTALDEFYNKKENAHKAKNYRSSINCDSCNHIEPTHYPYIGKCLLDNIETGGAYSVCDKWEEIKRE